jgi:hypothetical protein
MRSRKALYLVAVVSLLLGLGVLPVLAEDAIPMWVQRARLAYTGRSTGGPDTMVAYIHIRDAGLEMVEGADVTGLWTLPDGSTRPVVVTTNRMGIAKFYTWDGKGLYKFCVTAVHAEGRTYDPALNFDDVCPSMTAW